MKKSRFSFITILLASFVIFASNIVTSCENQFFKEAAGIYQVYFETNGGTEIDSRNTDKIKTEPVTYKQNADFLGWWDNSEFKGEKLKFPLEITKDTGLYAKWNEKYIVRFETNQGNPIQDQICNELTELPTPLKNDYTFAGWYLNIDFSEKEFQCSPENPVVLTRHITLYAKWKKNYTVTFESNGGSTVESIRTAIIETSPDINKTDYEFSGWYENADFSGKAITFPYEVNYSKTLYAKWKQVNFTVSFVTNCETTLKPYKTSVIEKAPNIYKDDFSLVGWYETQNFSSEVITFPYELKDDTTLFARWKQTSFMVDFNENGGSSVLPQKTSIIDTEPETSRENFIFDGWYPSSDFSGSKITFPFRIEKTTILYAKWLPTYLLKVETNGGSEVCSFRARTVENVQTPEKSGFTFDSWYFDENLTQEVSFPITLTSETTLYASYKENFTVTFEANGGSSVNPITACYIEESPVSTMKDNTFAGWYSNSECTEESKITFPLEISSNLTLYAKWYSEIYIITYNANGATSGSVPETVFVEKGKSFVISSNTGNLKKSDLAFTKWSTSTDGQSGQSYAPGYSLTPNKNMTLYAQWGKDYAEMVTVNGGSYYFGDPNEGSSRPKITLNSFQIAKYELTYELWLEVYRWATSNGYTLTSASKGYATNDSYKDFVPATNISWNMACVWLNAYSEYKGLEPVYYQGSSVWRDDTSTGGTFNWKQTKNGYRLPTECEWEFAAGGGSAEEHDKYIYAGSNTLSDVGWYYGVEATPVGTKKANKLGIYDMSGSVAEHCFDYFASFGTGELNNPIHYSGSYRIIRGNGSLNDLNKIFFRICSYSTVDTGFYYENNGESYPQRCDFHKGIRIVRNVE